MVKKQNGCQKQDGQPFENLTGQQDTTSLDRFINKRVIQIFSL
jgi:hypothetical protein